MDGYREHPSDFELPVAEAAPADDVASAIGTDERRMHVRAYNYWVSLLDGRDYPSIEDLEPGDVEDFAPHSVLLDFTAGRDNPATPYIGSAIREECGLGSNIQTIEDVPSRSLLSRLTDHYLQIIANRAPIGFEAEFENQRSEQICYRGILMPFSSDGDTIDFIYGVINWKRAHAAAAAEPAAPVFDPAPEDAATQVEADLEEHFAEPGAEAPQEWQDNPRADLQGESGDPSLDPAPVHFSWEDGPLADSDTENAAPAPIELDPDAGLADRLWAARESAEAVKSADCRSRAALYGALSMAYDFALAAQADPDEYADLLEESGMKAQVRAPMTPIVKLVFGIDYDKTRLTEFAAALSYGLRQGIELGGFLAFIEGQAGGLKALVAAERAARRPEPRQDSRTDAARARLRHVAPLSLDRVAAEGEFTLLLARRSAEGGVEAVAVVEDPVMVERAIRRASS